MVEKGEIVPVIEKTYKLDEIIMAHKIAEQGKIRGKICIEIIGER